MKILLPFIVMICAFSAFGQSSEVAGTTRASNGQIISLTNILALSDCPSRSFVGKVKGVKVDGRVARFGLSSKKETKDIEVHLDRVIAEDKAVLFKDLLKKGFVLRVAGYACGSSDKISAFTIDRVYSTKSK
ncbi:MAG: hypothetical protein ABJB40_07575 [Acidobacteriota bacterium]